MAKRILLAEANQQLAATIGARLKQHGCDRRRARQGMRVLQEQQKKGLFKRMCK